MSTKDIALVATPIDSVDAETMPLVMPVVGDWYWVKICEREWETPKKIERVFACVVHVGSNYVQFETPNGYTERVHISQFDDDCKREPNPDKVIDDHVREHQTEVARLMGRIKEVTALLAISTGPQLSSHSETQALALHSGRDMGEYTQALVKAKKETLPELFKLVEKQHEHLAEWMSARVVPMKATINGMKGTISAIDDRIFSVELYAGLVEQVVQVSKGKPADIGTKVHLMQRRAYMDEECLAQYETGGMDFKSIVDFDEWIAKPKNRDRILPFPRCIVAFRVRRYERDQGRADSISDFLRIMYEKEQDRKTFLYIRNGDQLFRMSTAIDFGDDLFPDLDRAQLTGKMWAEMFCNKIDRLITDNEFQELLAEHKRKNKEAKKLPRKERWFHESRWDQSRYHLFDPSSVYYDDIAKHIQKEVARHNRIALILQGLLDRSMVLHPHPPWQIWTDSGFNAALELVFDDSRTLTSGDKPDFEAYRAKLNASLKSGSITVGQQRAWMKYEAEKENKRRENLPHWRRDRHGYDRELTLYKPYGDPGPGVLSRVIRFTRKTGKCTYEWERSRQRRRNRWDRSESTMVKVNFTAESKDVLNVDAYTPGDFHKFFDDPRTRAEYLKWAPMLLMAEEFHAGNMKLGSADGQPEFSFRGDDE